MSAYRGRQSGPVRRCLVALLVLIAAGVLLFASALGVVLAGDRDDFTGCPPTAVVILGCQVMPSGEPSILLHDRLDTALDCLADWPEAVVVVPGRQGANEPVSEAQCMFEYLTAHGVAPDRILLEDSSGNTNENLRNSVAVLAEYGYDTTAEIAIVSNGFHLARVRMLWGRVGGGQDSLSTIAAPSSHAPSRLMMYLREPLALIKSFLFDRG